LSKPNEPGHIGPADVCVAGVRANLSVVFIVSGAIVAAVMLAVLVIVIIRLNYTRRCTPCELVYTTLTSRLQVYRVGSGRSRLLVTCLTAV